MSKTNDTSKPNRAAQVRELRDEELEKVSGGYKTYDVIVTSFAAPYHVGISDGTSNTIAFGE
jgi:hypothetical protein